ncbi:hypothetical protein Tco_1109595 [Tanacetum coccineum]
MWMKSQDNPLIPNLHPHLLNSTIKKPFIVPSSYQPKKTHKPRIAIRTTEISQSSRPINLVADDTVYKEWEDRMETVATTASSLDAEHDNGNINRTQSMATLNESFPQGTDSGSGPRFGEQKEKRDVNPNQSSLYQMANLDFCDTHNMIAFLNKSEGSEGFQQIVDFLNTSHIKFALTENPTIYTSLIQQFWQTASTSTLEDGEMKITATIDGQLKTITEASLRRHLKLEDADGISSLPNTKIFEQLALMGPKKTAWEQFSSNIATAIICLATNRTFNFSKMIFEGMVKNLDSRSKFLMYPRFIQILLNKHQRLLLPHKRTYVAPTLTQILFSNMRRVSKGYTGVDIPLFSSMLVQGPIQQGEGSTVPVESHHTPVTTPSTSQQPLSSPSMVPTPPHDLPLPGGHTPRSDEGRMQQTELMDLVIKLSDKVLALETDLQQTKKVYCAAVTKLIMKGRMIDDIDQDAGITLVTPTKTSTQEDHPEDQLGVLSAAKVLTDVARVHTYSRRRRTVSTGSGEVSTASRIISTAEETVSTAGASMPVSTAGLVQEITSSSRASKDKGKAVITESEPEQTASKLKERQERAGYEAAIKLQEQLDQEESQRIARDAEIALRLQEEIDAAGRQRMAKVHQAAQGFTEDEWENIKARVEADEELTQKLQAEEREKYSEVDQAKMLVDLINQRKRFFAQQRAEAKRNKPMTQAQQRTYMSNYIKNQEGGYSIKQLKSLSFKEVNEIFETTMRRVYSFVPMNSKLEVQRLKRAEVYQIFEDMLKRFDRDDLEKLWDLVKKRFKSTEPTVDKEKILWVELKRLFEPDDDDTLWKLQRYMHDPLKWRLYDTYGVHHVSTERGHDIFMLVENDYPLTKALMTVMLANKLQVDESSEMANELLKKIFILANNPRQ